MTIKKDGEASLGDIRKIIDAIDLEIHGLLNKRAEAALKLSLIHI